MMRTEKKVLIRVESDKQNNAKTRRNMKVIQQSATDKENLIGRSKSVKDANDSSDKWRKLMQNKSTQTGECVIVEEDLTHDEPSPDYWRRLAEIRGEALNKSFHENEKLKEDVEALQEENKIYKDMLEESKNLVEVLQEMLTEKDDDGEEPTENISN